MQTTPEEFRDTPTLEIPPQANTQSLAPIAPVWHTALLVAFIFAVSFIGVYRHTGSQAEGSASRLVTYGVTAALELIMVGWVALGLRLRKSIPSDVRSV